MKSIISVIIVQCLLLLSQTAWADTGLKTDKQKFSYTVGIQIGNNLKSGGDDVDIDAFIQAIRDVFAGDQYQLTTEEMQMVMQRYRDQQIEKRMAEAQSNRNKSKEFFDRNREKDGVVETGSGLQTQTG